MKTVKIISKVGNNTGETIEFFIDELQNNQELKDVVLNSEGTIARKYNVFLLNDDCKTYRQVEPSLLDEIIKEQTY